MSDRALGEVMGEVVGQPMDMDAAGSSDASAADAEDLPGPSTATFLSHEQVSLGDEDLSCGTAFPVSGKLHS